MYYGTSIMNKRRTWFVFNLEAGKYLETLFISAVATILGIRFYLHLANYPQLGGGGLHIAHMLWGGGLMLVAVVLLLAFLDKRAYLVAALAGGIGFGTFIDELGKFITSDNNYFFEPTVAILYVIFVVFFLAVRFLEKSRAHSQEEYSVKHLSALFKELALPTAGSGGRVYGLEDRLHTWYRNIVQHRWFTRCVMVFFILFSLFNLYKSSDVVSLYFRLNEFTLSYIDLGQFLSSIVSATIVVGSNADTRRPCR